ncbi:MAG: hypothetical protein WAV16_00350 [Candidatus Moraniibacteriota bacterium]
MSVQNKTKLLIFSCLLALGGVFAPNVNNVSAYWQNCTTAPSVCKTAFVCYVAGCNPTNINYDVYTAPSCTPYICTPPVCYPGGCSPPNCWMGSCWPGGCYGGWCSGGGCSGGGCTAGGYGTCAPGTVNCDNYGGCHSAAGTCGYTATTCTPGATSCSCGGVAGYNNWTSCNAANGTQTGYNPYYHNNCWDAASTRGCGVCNSTTSVTNYATAPPANVRCAFGTGTTPTLVGSTWTWTCNGTNGGSAPTCTAPYIVNGSCNGQLSGVHEYNVNVFPAGSLCTTGTPSPVSVTFPTTGGTVNWQCVGSGGGGTTANCSASRKLRPPTVDLKINGSDGPISPNRDAGAVLNISWNVTANNLVGTTHCSKNGTTWGSNAEIIPTRPLISSDNGIPLPSDNYPIDNRSYSLTCQNIHTNPALSSAQVVDTVGVSVYCNQGDQIWSECTTQCDGGTKSCQYKTTRCNMANCASATCNTDSCPVSGEIREVQ